MVPEEALMEPVNEPVGAGPEGAMVMVPEAPEPDLEMEPAPEKTPAKVPEFNESVPLRTMLVAMIWAAAETVTEELMVTLASVAAMRRLKELEPLRMAVAPELTVNVPVPAAALAM